MAEGISSAPRDPVVTLSVDDQIRDNLFKTRIAPDLLAALESSAAADPQWVILEVDTTFPGGAERARRLLIALLAREGLISPDDGRLQQFPLAELLQAPQPQLDAYRRFSPAPGDTVQLYKSLHTESYVFAKLAPATIESLATLDASTQDLPQPVYKIWLDHATSSFVFASARTIKCDAARIAFATSGEGVIWAVADTGIDGGHPHFKRHENLKLPPGIFHQDFTAPHADDQASNDAALQDAAGHGTHVAGIIAGETLTKAAAPGDREAVKEIRITRKVRAGIGGAPVTLTDTSQATISGMAPRCTLLSLKVLKDTRTGLASDLIAAIGYIRRLNGPNGHLKVHGLNLSLGYPFDPEWFAAGQSPLCLEVDRLVRSGVVVVAAAGNAGYGRVTTRQGTSEAATLLGTIADPGNAERAITVGSTHRDMPHIYGVSYFSAKGPTADGRLKPDLLAPGERIISCAANGVGAEFKEDTGTSMAAPHVSGAIAGFLSVRREYIERPDEVKAIFVAAATDLKRRPEFQGGGLVDLMRALQAI